MREGLGEGECRKTPFIMTIQPHQLPITSIPRQLTQQIEQTLLLGKLSDLDQLLARIEDIGLADTLRYGLEALRHFRAFYASDAIDLPNDKREQVIRYDADWTMTLIKQLHQDSGVGI